MKHNTFILFALIVCIFTMTSSIYAQNTDMRLLPNESDNLQDSIIVAGQIKNISQGMSRTFIINECDISHRSTKELGEVGEMGYFSKKIPFSYPHTFTLNYNLRNFINAFAAPGDSIYMDIDASTHPLKVDFSGDNADINRQYNVAFQELSKFYNNQVELPADTLAIDDYIPVFKRYLEEGRKMVDTYAASHGVSENVKSMLYVDNTYILANMACGYKGRNLDEKRAFFLDPVFDIFNEKNTKVMIFPYHLAAIMNHFEDVRDNAPKGIIRDLMYACDNEAPAPDRSVFFNQKYYDRIYAKSNEVKEISIEGRFY